MDAGAPPVESPPSTFSLRKVLRFVSAMISLVSALSILLMLLRVRHVRRVFDDFEFAAGFRRDGFLPHLGSVYRQWSGRTVMVLLDGVINSCGNWASALVIGASILTFVSFGSTVVSRLAGLPRSAESFGLCAAPFVLILWTMPAQGQVLYWVSGATVYLLPMSLLAVAWSLAFVALPSPAQTQGASLTRAVRNGLLGVCAALGAGGNETLAVGATIGVLAALWIARGSGSARERMRSWAGLRLLAVSTVIGAAVLYGAPGQRSRAQRSAPSSDPVEVMRVCIRAIQSLLKNALPQAGIALAVGFLIVVVAVERESADAIGSRVGSGLSTSRWTELTRDWEHACLVAALAACGSWASLVVIAGFGSKVVPPARAVAAPYALTLLAMVCVGGVLGAKRLSAGVAFDRRVTKAKPGSALGAGPSSEGWSAWLAGQGSGRSAALGSCLAFAVMSIVAVTVWTDGRRLDRADRSVARALDCAAQTIDEQLAAVSSPDRSDLTVQMSGPQMVHDVWYALPSAEAWPNRRMAEFYQVKAVVNTAGDVADCERG